MEFLLVREVCFNLNGRYYLNTWFSVDGKNETNRIKDISEIIHTSMYAGFRLNLVLSFNPLLFY